MFQFGGWLNEKLGRSVNKAMLLKKIGTQKVTVNKYNPSTGEQEFTILTEQVGYTNDMKPIINTKKVPVTVDVEFPQYAMVRSTYFKNAEKTC